MTDLDQRALDSATWKFIEAWRKHTDAKMPGVVWNNSKAMIRAAIETYLDQAGACEQTREGMKPLEIAKLLGIRHAPPGTTEIPWMWGAAHSIERLYWAGYHEGQLESSWTTTHTTFALGDLVEKRRGSSWHGRIVGWYSTDLTPEGYAVESDHEPGSVQIYPAVALRLTDLAEDLCDPEKLI
jgi:dihydrofolate reductase (trimethoprim resistance protein)